MTDPVVITPDPPLNPGLDYAALKVEGTRLVQELSGAIWTDYNEHDPGVTTLEQLCYALTELSYRAELPLQTLLLDPKTRRIDTRRQALFAARRVLPGGPFIQDDYRKLIVDRVPGVANVWMMPRPPTPPPQSIDGLYDIAVYAPSADPCGCDGTDHLRPEVIRERVRRVYCGHRTLCEDVHDVFLLDSLPTVVSGAAIIDNSLAAESILARILFNLGQYLAPEVQRQPLSALMNAGLEPAAIFNGPLLRHGFIASDQLTPKPKAIVLSDIVRAMARSAGVMSVRDVAVRVGDQVARGTQPAPIPVPATAMPRLETQPVDGRYPIRLWRNGIEVKPDPARVNRELDRLWTDYRRRYPLARQYSDYFAVPKGEVRDLERYYSIQNQYPNVYGINSYGLPEYATTTRKAQARQLKGYLLAFEQLLADFFAQLTNVRELYSTDAQQTPTYYYQYLYSSVPDVAPLLRSDYREGLARIVTEDDAVAARRGRFLDLLLALYSERLNSDLMPFVNDSRNPEKAMIHAKLALLRHLIDATRDRGIGFDYLAKPSRHNIAGMVIRSRIELGMAPLPRRPLADHLEETGLVLVEDESEHTIGAVLVAHSDHIEQTFTPLDKLRDELRRAAEEEEITEQASASLLGHRTSEVFLRAMAEGDVRIGALPGDSMVAVACRSPAGPEWRLAGKFANPTRALAVLALLIAQAESLTESFRQLYVVEHILLRFARDRLAQTAEEELAAQQDDGAGPAAPDGSSRFAYSFTLTAVVSDVARHAEVSGYRAGVAEVLRRNAPAHVVVECCFLRPHRMAHFERLYGEWRWALRHGDRHRRAAASRRLQSFLERAKARAHHHHDRHQSEFAADIES